METINLKILNMKSAHCQMAVRQAVKNVGGEVTSVAPTQASIKLMNGITKEAVIKAIELAGYKIND